MSKISAKQLNLNENLNYGEVNDRQLIIPDDSIGSTSLSIQYKEIVINSDDFVFGTYSTSKLPSRAVGYTSDKLFKDSKLFRNGVQVDELVDVLPTSSNEWLLSQDYIYLFGDVTTSGDVYTLKYWVYNEDINSYQAGIRPFIGAFAHSGSLESGNVTLTTTLQDILLTNVSYDSFGFHSGGSTTDFVIPVGAAGYYQITSRASLNNNSVGINMRINVNDGGIVFESQNASSGGAANRQISATVTRYLAEGVAVSVAMSVVSGTLASTNYYCDLELIKLA